MAGEQRQEWTWRDIFRSIGLAFSFSRLVTGFLGLAVLAAADGLITWGMKSLELQSSDWLRRLAEVLYYARWGVAAYVFLFTAAAIAYSVKGELLDGEGAGVGESIAFVFRKFGALFFSPVIFWSYILLMGGLAFVFFVLPVLVAEWAGWTPYASLIWYALGYFFVFLFSLLAAMGFVAFMFSLFLTPPIVAVRQEGALDAVLDTIDLMRGKGAFWVSLLVLAASALVGGVFLGRTFDVGYRIAGRAMGEEFALIVKSMPQELQPRAGTLLSGARIYWPGQYEAAGRPFMRMGAAMQPASAGRPETRHKIAGWVLGVWVLILAGFSISFTMGAFVAAGTLTYLIVREEEEFLEPAAEGPPQPAAPKQEAAAKSEGAEKPEKPEKKDEAPKAEEKKA